MKTPISQPRLLGIVEFPLVDMLVRPSRYGEIVDLMAVLRTDADLARNRVTYLVWNPSFKEVPEGVTTPIYDVTVWNGRLFFAPREDERIPITHFPTAAASI